MSSAFVRESGGMPQVFASRESAESAAEIQRAMGHRLYGKGIIHHLADLELLGRRTNLVRVLPRSSHDATLSGLGSLHQSRGGSVLHAGPAPRPAGYTARCLGNRPTDEVRHDQRVRPERSRGFGDRR